MGGEEGDGKKRLQSHDLSSSFESGGSIIELILKHSSNKHTIFFLVFHLKSIRKCFRRHFIFLANRFLTTATRKIGECR
jgi:hypothetical protein